MVLEFFMPMIPPTVTHQEKKVHVVKGKPVYYEPENLKAARMKLIGHLRSHVPEEPVRSGVRLLVKCASRFLAGIGAENTRLRNRTRTTSKSF